MSVSYSLLKVVLKKININFYLHRFGGIDEYKIRSRYYMYVIKDILIVVFNDDLNFSL